MGFIVALGGGGFSTEPDNPLLDRHVLSLSRGADQPRVCFVPTASGDNADYRARFHEAFGRLGAVTSELLLFDREVEDLRAFVLAQDVLYVGGGNTAALLAVWRVHGLDRVLPEALEDGVVLAGISAGMNCWFEASVTDSFGVDRLDPLHDGLGLVGGSACPHYDDEPLRRPTYRKLVAGGFPPGHAADDGVALVFEDGRLAEVVSSRPDAHGYRVALRDGVVAEDPLPARFVGA
jgi:dipeptidase E